MPLLNPRVDLAFKKIFGSPENKDLLISFINSVVSEEDQVADIELLNPYNPQNFANDKFSVLDIKAQDLRGHYFNIEVQISNEGDYDKRALYYWAKLYTSQLGNGGQYKNLRKAIGIHVLNFISVVNAPNYVNKFVVTNEVTKARHFEDLELFTIELCKFEEGTDGNINQLLPRIKNGLDRWAAFLTKARELDRNQLPPELDHPCIKKAFEVLRHVSLNDTEREFYEGHLKWLMIEDSTLERAKKESREEGRKEGIEEGLKKGVEKGRLEEKIKMAKELMESHAELEFICRVTGLTKEQLESYLIPRVRQEV